MAAAQEFIRSLGDIIDERNIGRDNLIHRRLVGGEFTPEMLREWCRQHWLFIRAYPSYLCLVAGNAPDPQIRAEVVRIVYEWETGGISGSPSRIAQWEQVCEALGVTHADLSSARALPTTEAMLATQELVARRSFVEGAAGLLVGSREGAPAVNARRDALASKYGVPDSSLSYFDAQTRLARPADNASLLASAATDELQQEAARAALRRVLNARWEYYSGIGRAFGWIAE